MKRTRLFLLGLWLASLVFPPTTWAASVTYPIDGSKAGDAVLVDDSTGKAFCAQVPGGAITTPAGSNVPLDSCASTVLAPGDFCSGPGQPGIACKKDDGTLDGADLTPPFYTRTSPVVVVGLLSKTMTVTYTGSTTLYVTETMTGTATGASSGTDTSTATGTIIATVTAMTTATGTSTLTLQGSGSGTSTATQTTAGIGLPLATSPGLVDFGDTAANNVQVDSAGNLYVTSGLRLRINGGLLGQRFAWSTGVGYSAGDSSFGYPNGLLELSRTGLRLAVFGWNGSTFLGGASTDTGADAPFWIQGLTTGLGAGRVFVRGSYLDPNQSTTSVLFSVGGSRTTPAQFRVLGSGRVISQDTIEGTNITSLGHAIADVPKTQPLTFSGGLVGTVLTGTGTGTSTWTDTATTTNTSLGSLTGISSTVTNTMTNTGITCQPGYTCAYGNWAMFYDSTHIFPAPYVPANPAEARAYNTAGTVTAAATWVTLATVTINSTFGSVHAWGTVPLWATMPGDPVTVGCQSRIIVDDTYIGQSASFTVPYGEGSSQYENGQTLSPIFWRYLSVGSHTVKLQFNSPHTICTQDPSMAGADTGTTAAELIVLTL